MIKEKNRFIMLDMQCSCGDVFSIREDELNVKSRCPNCVKASIKIGKLKNVKALVDNYVLQLAELKQGRDNE